MSRLWLALVALLAIVAVSQSGTEGYGPWSPGPRRHGKHEHAGRKHRGHEHGAAWAAVRASKAAGMHAAGTSTMWM